MASNNDKLLSEIACSTSASVDVCGAEPQIWLVSLVRFFSHGYSYTKSRILGVLLHRKWGVSRRILESFTSSRRVSSVSVR